MKTLQNTKRIMQRSMSRILAIATLGAIAMASVPAHAADQAVNQAAKLSDAVYRTAGTQSINQNQPRLVKAEFSVGINFGHGFGHSKHYYGGHKGHFKSKKYYGNGLKFRGSFHNGNRRFSNRFRGSNRGFSNRFRGSNRGFSNRFRGGNRGFSNRFRGGSRGFGGRRR